MFKKEVIWREILFQATQKGKKSFQQKEVAQKFGFSLSTVFHALKVPRAIQAIKADGNGFELASTEKLLYLWATCRNLKKETVYKTFVSAPIARIEGNMPGGIVWGAFSAYKYKFDAVPSEYGQVYVYADQEELREIKKRFPFKRGPENLIVFKKDDYWQKENLPLAQVFVDIWNLSDWYCKEFLSKLAIKLKL